MKSAHDPRHEQRIRTVQALFTYAFDAGQGEGIGEIVAVLPQIDAKIGKIATERPLPEMNKLDLAILRLGVFELMYQHQNPAIAIDEAVEIAKEYGGDASPKLINAVLGKIAESL